MSIYIVLAVFFAAFLHAFWNIIIKGGDNKLYEAGLNALGSGVGAACFLPLVTPLPIEVWPYLLMSSFCHFIYYLCLAEAYKKDDFSFSYTVMRGCAPLLTSLVMLCLGTELSFMAWGGVLILCSGIFCLAGGGQDDVTLYSLLPAFRTSVVIMGYTIFDGLGARQAGDAVGYTCWIFVCNILPINLYIFLRHGRDYLVYARVRARSGLLGGFAGLASYGIAIWAMTSAPIVMVAALRETSIIFGMLLAVFLLGEKFDLRRTLAVMLVVFGVTLMRLA